MSISQQYANIIFIAKKSFRYGFLRKPLVHNKASWNTVLYQFLGKTTNFVNSKLHSNWCLVIHIFGIIRPLCIISIRPAYLLEICLLLYIWTRLSNLFPLLKGSAELNCHFPLMNMNDLNTSLFRENVLPNYANMSMWPTVYWTF